MSNQLPPDLVEISPGQPISKPDIGMPHDLVEVTPQAGGQSYNPNSFPNPGRSLEALQSLLPVANPNAQVPEQELTTGQQIARTAVKAFFPNLLLEDAANAISLQSGVSQGIRRFNQGLPLGFGDSLRGGLDTLGDVVSNNVVDNPDQGYLSDVYDQYQYNRDFHRKQVEIGSEKSPFSNAIGAVASMLPSALLPMAKVGSLPGIVNQIAKVAPQIGGMADYMATTFPRLLTHLINTGEVGAIGSMIGAGMSDEDFIKNPMAVINDGLETGLLAAGAYQAAPVLQWLSKMSSPKTINNLGGVKALSGGGDASKGLKLTRHDEYTSAAGLDLMQKEGKVVLHNNVITNLPSADASFLKSPSGAAKGFLQSRIAKNPNANMLDMKQAMADVESMVSQRAEQADSLLQQAFNNKPINPALVFGNGASKRTNALLENLGYLKQDMIESQARNYDGDAFRMLDKVLRKQSLTVSDLNIIKQQLGELVGKKAWTQGAKPGSLTAQLMDDYNAIRNFMQEGVDSLGKVQGRAWNRLQTEQSNLLSLKGHIEHGLDNSIDALGAQGNFSGSPVQGLAEGAASLGNNGGAPGGGAIPWLLNFLGKGGGLGGQMTAGLGKATLTRPSAAAWIGQVFTSYDAATKQLRSKRDIELYNHYVDTVPTLTAQQRALYKLKANTNGTIDPIIVPKPIQEAAKKRLGYVE